MSSPLHQGKKKRQQKRRKEYSDKARLHFAVATPSSSVTIPFTINATSSTYKNVQWTQDGWEINLSGSKFRLIREVYEKYRTDNISFLNLSDNYLVECPLCLQLNNIRSMSFRSNKFMSFELKNMMRSLMELNLSSNLLTEFPSAAAIEKMPSLRKLFLNNNQIKDIPTSSIKALTAHNRGRFEVLNLSYNKLTSIPHQIGNLRSLLSLNLSNNDIVELPREITKLSRLYSSPVALDIHGNKLIQPPQEIAQRCGMLTIADYFNDASTSESGEYGNHDPSASISEESSLYYFGNKSMQPTKSQHLKMIMVGHEESGKSSIVEMLKHAGTTSVATIEEGEEGAESHGSSGRSYPSTFSRENSAANPPGAAASVGTPIGTASRLYNSSGFLLDKALRERAAAIAASDNYTPSSPNTRHRQDQQPDIKINVWNFVGSATYYASHELFFSTSALHLIVWDIRKSLTTSDFDEYVQFWIDLIQARAPGATMMIVATHSDMLEATPYSFGSCGSGVDVVSEVIQRLQAHLADNEALRLQDLQRDIKQIQALTRRTERDNHRLEKLQRLLVDRPHIHNVVVPVSLDADLRGIYSLIHQIVNVITPGAAVGTIAEVEGESGKSGDMGNSSGNDDSTKNASASVSAQNDVHPFNILNIDLPIYYKQVKKQMDEMRRRKQSYCTIQELDEYVNGTSSGGGGNHNRGFGHMSRSQVVNVSESVEGGNGGVSKTYERTKNAIVYWATVGEIIWFSGDADTKFSQMDMTADIPVRDLSSLNTGVEGALAEGMGQTMTSSVSIPGVMEGLHHPPMPRRTRLDSLDSVKSIASAKSGKSSNYNDSELQFQFRDSYAGDSLDPMLSNNFSLADCNSSTTSGGHGPLYLETTSAYLDLHQQHQKHQSSVVLSGGQPSPYNNLQTGRHLDDDDEASGEGHYWPYDFHEASASYDLNDGLPEGGSSSMMSRDRSGGGGVGLMGPYDESDEEEDGEEEYEGQHLFDTDGVSEGGSTLAAIVEDKHAEKKEDLLSDVVFLSPHWLKEAIIGVLDEDIRAKLHEISPHASHANGVLPWQQIEQLLLADKRTVLREIKHDENALQQTLAILREVMVRLNIIIPIENSPTVSATASHPPSMFNSVMSEHNSFSKLLPPHPMEVEAKYLVPSLLTDPPLKDQQGSTKFAHNDSIRLERRYSFSRFIPTNIIPRIIAKMYSRYGYVLKTMSSADSAAGSSAFSSSGHEADKNTCWSNAFIQDCDDCTVWVLLDTEEETLDQPVASCVSAFVNNAYSINTTTATTTSANNTSAGASTAVDDSTGPFVGGRDTRLSSDAVVMDADRLLFQDEDFCVTEEEVIHAVTISEPSTTVSLATTSTEHTVVVESDRVAIGEDHFFSSNVFDNAKNEIRDTLSGGSPRTPSTSISASILERNRSTSLSAPRITKLLRIIGSGHLFHVRSVVKCLDNYCKVIDEILSEYKGISLLTPSTLCPVCLMKQIPESECGRIPFQDEALLRASLRGLCYKDSSTILRDPESTVVAGGGSGGGSSVVKKSLVEEYYEWIKTVRVPCAANHCNIRPDFLIPVPSKIQRLLKVDQYNRSIVDYVRDDIIYQTKLDTKRTPFNDAELQAKLKQDMSASMVYVLPLHATADQLSHLQQLFTVSSNDPQVLTTRVLQLNVKTGSVLSGVRMSNPLNDSRAREMMILTAFLPGKAQKDWNYYYLVGTSEGWTHLAQYVPRPERTVVGHRSDAALLRVLSVIDPLSLTIVANTVSLTIRFRSDFVYADTGDRFTASSSKVVKCVAIPRETTLRIEQNVQVWGYCKLSLYGGNWARIVRRIGECWLVSLYSDENLVGGPVVNEFGDVVGVISNTQYKHGKQSAYFVASIQSLLVN